MDFLDGVQQLHVFLPDVSQQRSNYVSMYTPSFSLHGRTRGLHASTQYNIYTNYVCTYQVHVKNTLSQPASSNIATSRVMEYVVVSLWGCESLDRLIVRSIITYEMRNSGTGGVGSSICPSGIHGNSGCLNEQRSATRARGRPQLDFTSCGTEVLCGWCVGQLRTHENVAFVFVPYTRYY